MKINKASIKDAQLRKAFQEMADKITEIETKTNSKVQPQGQNISNENFRVIKTADGGMALEAKDEKGWFYVDLNRREK